MENFGGPILQKYAEINKKGKERIETHSFDLFTGFPESLRQRFITAVEFTPDSTTEFNERVATELETLEHNLGIRFVIAGRDFPLHSTILEGASTEDLDTADPKFKVIQDATQLDWENLTLRFDYILLDGGNLLLVAKEIPEQILAAREQLSDVYTEHSLKPLRIQNILHATAARITELPTEFDPAEYRSAITDLRHTISSSPLILTVDHVARERSYDFLHKS